MNKTTKDIVDDLVGPSLWALDEEDLALIPRRGQFGKRNFSKLIVVTVFCAGFPELRPDNRWSCRPHYDYTQNVTIEYFFQRLNMVTFALNCLKSQMEIKYMGFITTCTIIFFNQISNFMHIG